VTLNGTFIWYQSYDMNTKFVRMEVFGFLEAFGFE
jgi:hypothetical protein